MKTKRLTLCIFTLLGLLIACKQAISETAITVYKSPTCGCCSKWISHMENSNFKAKAIEYTNMSHIKDNLAIPQSLRSCHTGVVQHAKGQYIFEGHIPAETIQRFLENPPANAIGLAVPGMPIGSPGMEVGERKDTYNVVLITKTGEDKIYEKIND